MEPVEARGYTPEEVDFSKLPPASFLKDILRKLKSTLFMTTPSIRNLDSRMRLLTNILVDCHKVSGGFLYDLYDYQGERFLRRRFLPRPIANELFATGMYDSHAIVRAVTFPQTERAFQKFLDHIVEALANKDGGPPVLSDLDDLEEEEREKNWPVPATPKKRL